MPSGLAVITQKIDDGKGWRGRGGTGALAHRWRECDMAQALGKMVCQFLRKLSITLSHDLEIS